MKVSRILKMVSGLGLVVTVIGCGESFQGTFVGDKITVYNPTNNAEQSCSLDVGSDYQIELKVQVSGDEVETTITKLARPGQTSSQAAQVLTGYAVNSSLNNDTAFTSTRTRFSNSRTVGDRTENVSVSGRLSAARDQIDNFDWVYEGFFNNTDTPCSLGVRGTGIRTAP